MTYSLKPVLSDERIIDRLHSSPGEFEKTASYLHQRFKGFIGKAKGRYPSLSEEDLQDAYNDALDALIKKIIHQTFDPDKGSISTLFYQIFSNKCVDQMRKITNNRSEWEKQLEQITPDLPVGARDFLQQVLEKEAFEGIVHCMDELNPPCKSLIMDIDYWGFSPEEAASRNGYKNGQSASQAKYRCMETLRKKIAKKNEHGSAS